MATKPASASRRPSSKKRSAIDGEPPCGVPLGILLAIGGKENKGEEQPEDKQKPTDFVKLAVLTRFRDLIGKKDPVVEVVTTASGQSQESFGDYRKAFGMIDIHPIGHIHHDERQQVLDDPMSERLGRADAVFFSGGDQLRLTSIYGGTDFLLSLKKRYIHEKIVIAGTSAGAMAMSTPMIYAGNEEVQELGGEIKVTTGLEFLKDVCVDTHFVHRGRIIRMAQVVASNPSCLGIGIEEDTAVVIRNGVDVEVVGSGLVVILEGFGVSSFDVSEFTKSKPVSIRNLSMHLLSSGNQYTIRKFEPAHQ